MSTLTDGRRRSIAFTLNGRPVRGDAEPRMLLSDFLRHVIGATGTHVGCEHGVCGACTVQLDGAAVRSCLTLAVQTEGRSVVTVEGLGCGSEGDLTILQRAFKRNFALQCGFCTAGILVSLTDYLSHCPDPTEQDLREVIGGHLCRCTGYTPIVKAAIEAAAEMRAETQGGSRDV